MLHVAAGREREALTLLRGAHEVFERLGARADLADVDRRIAALGH